MVKTISNWEEVQFVCHLKEKGKIFNDTCFIGRSNGHSEGVGQQDIEQLQTSYLWVH